VILYGLLWVAQASAIARGSVARFGCSAAKRAVVQS